MRSGEKSTPVLAGQSVRLSNLVSLETRDRPPLASHIANAEAEQLCRVHGDDFAPDIRRRFDRSPYDNKRNETVYFQTDNDSQGNGKDKESNWLPPPAGNFSIWRRAYWADQAISD